jgi:serine/threonine protein kinase
MADRNGTQIAGYRIESLIARGGMGEVYLATHTFPERRVALKLLSKDLASDPGFRERFIRESNAAASIEHPNIVPIYGRSVRRRSVHRDAIRGRRGPEGVARP